MMKAVLLASFVAFSSSARVVDQRAFRMGARATKRSDSAMVLPPANYGVAPATSSPKLGTDLAFGARGTQQLDVVAAPADKVWDEKMQCYRTAPKSPLGGGSNAPSSSYSPPAPKPAAPSAPAPSASTSLPVTPAPAAAPVGKVWDDKMQCYRVAPKSPLGGGSNAPSSSYSPPAPKASSAPAPSSSASSLPVTPPPAKAPENKVWDDKMQCYRVAPKSPLGGSSNAPSSSFSPPAPKAASAPAPSSSTSLPVTPPPAKAPEGKVWDDKMQCYRVAPKSPLGGSSNAPSSSYSAPAPKAAAPASSSALPVTKPPAAAPANKVWDDKLQAYRVVAKRVC